MGMLESVNGNLLKQNLKEEGGNGWAATNSRVLRFWIQKGEQESSDRDRQWNDIFKIVLAFLFV